MQAQYCVVVDENDKDAYQFRGGNRKLIACRLPQAMLSGPSDTGKTFTCCVKVHLLCCRYAGSQHSIIRKTFASLAGSVCQTFERVSAGAGVQTLGADSPRLYTYPNGSKVWLGGMDRPEKTLSSERDSIYIPQAEQLTQNEWELLSRAVSGRSAIVPCPQLFGDCNPAGSKHWLREHAKTGKMVMFTTTHKDNPSLYHSDGTEVRSGEIVCGIEMKRSGTERIKTLSDFTGVRRKRLFEGIWATAEGAVYDTFDAAVHVSVRTIGEMQRFRLAIDEGYTNPAVILVLGVDADGRKHCFKEFYQTNVLPSEFVKTALDWFKEFHCERASVDESAAGLIADFNSVGMVAIGGKGRVLDGINKVQDRLAICGDRRPRYTIDPSCENHINEFESYVWAKDKPKDTPVKENDHSLDALRYDEDVDSVPSGAIKSVDDLYIGNVRPGLVPRSFTPRRFG